MVYPAHHGSTAAVSGEDDALLPKLIEKSLADVIQEIMTVSVKVSVPVDLFTAQVQELSIDTFSAKGCLLPLTISSVLSES